MGWRDWALLGARLLVAALFLSGAAQKWLSPGDVEGLLAGRGLPEWLIWPAMLFDLGAGVALVLGAWTAPTALALAAYCGATSVFHLIPADPWQVTIFVKNWAIAGGCLALAAAGPGRIALGPPRQIRAARGPGRPRSRR